jgi:dTDP-glucose 4,6-dehydratase
MYKISERGNLQIVEAIFTIFDTKAPKEESYKELLTFVEDRISQDRRYAIDIPKLESILDWKADEDFDSRIIKTIEWYSEKYNV